jgi:Arginase family
MTRDGRALAVHQRCHLGGEPLQALYAFGDRWGGLSAREGIEFLRGLAGLDIVAVDVNTVSPPHDVQNMTAFLAAQIIYESLVLLCRKPG